MKKFLGALFAAAVLFQPINSSAVEPASDQCTVLGTEGDDTLTGTNGADVICGLGGNDTITAGDGNDTVYGGDGKDTILGGSGNDSLNGGAGEDDIWGDAGTDSLFGDAGDDGLDGGGDVDTLSGGEGKDICVGFTSDNYTRGDCNVDSAAPVISNIQVESGNSVIDSTTGTATFTFTFDATDHGSGLISANFYFQPAAKISKPNAPASASVANPVPTCTINKVTNCRLSGTAQFGHYRATAQLPGKLTAGQYLAATIATQDRLFNYKEIRGTKVASAGLSFGFTQTGTPDLQAPVLTDWQIVSADANYESAYDVVRVRAHVTDANKLSLLVLHFTAPDAGNKKVGDIVLAPGFIAVQNCTQSTSPYDSCLYSGTLSDGVVEFPLQFTPIGSNRNDMTYLYKAQKIVPSYYEATDNMSNRSSVRFSTAQKNALTTYKAWSFNAPVDDKDKKAPVLKSFTVSTKTINTASADATFTVTARITDSGVGVNLYERGLVNVSAQPAAAAGIECVQAGNAVGKPTDATFTFNCVIPQYAMTGEWLLGIDAMDMSLRQNQLSLGGTELKSKRFQYSVTNG